MNIKLLYFYLQFSIVCISSIKSNFEYELFKNRKTDGTEKENSDTTNRKMASQVNMKYVYLELATCEKMKESNGNMVFGMFTGGQEGWQ